MRFKPHAMRKCMSMSMSTTDNKSKASNGDGDDGESMLTSSMICFFHRKLGS
jgi:hypothetical protein